MTETDASALIDARIAELGGWRGETLARLRRLIREADPEIVEAVKWNTPFYGSPDGPPQTWFLSYHCFTNYVKVTFFRGTSLDPVPAGKSKHPEVRYLDVREGALDEARFAEWVRQASRLPGETM